MDLTKGHSGALPRTCFKWIAFVFEGDDSKVPHRLESSSVSRVEKK